MTVKTKITVAALVSAGLVLIGQLQGFSQSQMGDAAPKPGAMPATQDAMTPTMMQGAGTNQMPSTNMPPGTNMPGTNRPGTNIPPGGTNMPPIRTNMPPASAAIR